MSNKHFSKITKCLPFSELLLYGVTLLGENLRNCFLFVAHELIAFILGLFTWSKRVTLLQYVL